MTRDDQGRLGAELALHDDLIRRRGVDVWVGAEPTFTRAEATDAPWHYQAEGGDKLERARSLLAALARTLPAGATLHRVVGRQFPEEEAPRFAWGARWPRSAAPATVCPEPPPLDSDPAPPPALDDGDAWLTVTPDPGVVEVNMAPAPDSTSFLAQATAVWRAAEAAGLASVRYRYNGDVADSGGGGQITLGGPTAAQSPFFRYPHLLPALVRYVNNHPSLSYWFAGECVGSASQAPRADEGAPERWEELGLTLEWLEHLADRGELPADRLWLALAPLLVDASGNSHRAELNVEKLWNPHIAGRGKLGVVEWRAFRMPAHPGMLAATAALLRALITRLVVAPYREPLIDHRDDIHDAWALPHLLARDLRHVLGDLDEHGVGLPPSLRAELDAWRDPGITCHLGTATLGISRAVDFWPLLGDTASQELATARLVDASIERWQLMVTGSDRDWLVVGGRRVDLPAADEGGARVIGVRRRAWVPSPGLHPGLPAQDPLVISWGHGGEHQRISLHAWRPLGGAYDGLPVDAADATRRRTERIAIHTAYDPLPRPQAAHRRAGPYTIDLRRPAPSSTSASEKRDNLDLDLVVDRDGDLVVDRDRDRDHLPGPRPDPLHATATSPPPSPSLHPAVTPATQAPAIVPLMSRPLLALALALAITRPAAADGLSSEDLARKNERGYVTGVPLAAYSTDIGLGGGARLYYYWNGHRSDPRFRRTPYLHRLFAQAFATTKGIQFHWIDYDAPSLLGSPLRVRSQLILLRNLVSNYFGIGEAAMAPLAFPGADRSFDDFAAYSDAQRQLQDGMAWTRYDQYEVIRPIAIASVERQLLRDRLRLLAGLGVTYAVVRDYTGKSIDAVDAAGADVDAIQATTRLRADCDAGIVTGCDGGRDHFLRLGVAYDTRDFEPDPNRGVFLDLALDVGTVAVGSQYDYARVLATARGWWSPLPADLVLAGRALLQVQSADTPFFAMSTMPFTDDPRAGLGGHRTMRGFRQDRFVGPVMALVNAEVRWTFARTRLWTQRLGFIVAPFVDVGRAADDLGGLAARWRPSGGAALRLSWNLATLVTVDYGKSGEDSGLYVNFGHMF